MDLFDPFSCQLHHIAFDRSSAKSLILDSISVEMSFMYRENKKGSRTGPGGHPTKPAPSQIVLHIQQRIAD